MSYLANTPTFNLSIQGLDSLRRKQACLSLGGQGLHGHVHAGQQQYGQES